MTRSRENPHRSYLTTNEVAEMLMVSPATIRNWVHNGWLQGESTAGGHRRFQRRQVESFARGRKIAIQPSDSGSLRILVVDDDTQFARFMVELVQESTASVDVRVATNGFEAGTLIREFEPHVVLLDLLMPRLNGLDVCRRLKSDPVTRTVRVIGVTGTVDPGNYADFLRAGAELCLSKPIDTRVLLDALGLPYESVDLVLESN